MKREEHWQLEIKLLFAQLVEMVEKFWFHVS